MDLLLLPTSIKKEEHLTSDIYLHDGLQTCPYCLYKVLNAASSNIAFFMRQVYQSHNDGTCVASNRQVVKEMFLNPIRVFITTKKTKPET